MTLTIKLDRNWNSFQLANSAPPLSVTDSAIAPSARMVIQATRKNMPQLCIALRLFFFGCAAMISSEITLRLPKPWRAAAVDSDATLSQLQPAQPAQAVQFARPAPHAPAIAAATATAAAAVAVAAATAAAVDHGNTGTWEHRMTGKHQDGNSGTWEHGRRGRQEHGIQEHGGTGTLQQP